MLKDRLEVARFLVGRGAESDLLMAAALGDLALVEKHLAADPRCMRMKVSGQWFPKRNPRSGGTIYIWTLGWNKTAPFVARQFGHEAVFQKLVSLMPPEQQFAIAASLGDQAGAAEWLRRDPDLIKNLEPDDLEALVHAAQHNDLAAVDAMLSAGWPADVLNASKASALHWSAFHGNAAMAERLLREKPPIDEPDREFHSTPLGWAVYGSENGCHRDTGDYPGVVRRLLAAGAAPPETISGSPAVRAVLTGD